MTDISVACLLQNANAALGENYPNVAPNLMQEVSRKPRTQWGFFAPEARLYYREHYSDDGGDAAA